MSLNTLEKSPAQKLQRQDRRRNARHRILADVWVDPGGMEPAVSVMLLDVSTSGAKLACPAQAALPDRFILHEGFSRRHARVVWRRGNRVGVVFEQADAAAET
jgi:hypothetical protein